MLSVITLLVSTTMGATPIDFNACPARALSLPGSIDEAKKAVLTVIGNDGLGAAVVLDPSGIALTAAHVVGNGSEVTVRTNAGLELTAEVVQVDTERDLAVIDVMGKGHACLSPSFDRLGTGTDVFAIGTPAGEALAFSVAKGVVAGYPEVDGRHFLQTDASLNPGNSGGPLLSPDGKVVAVVSWKVAGAEYEGLGFGIPMEVVKDTFGGLDGALVFGVKSDSGPATVSFDGTREGITIAMLASQQSAVGSSQYGTVSFVSNQWDDLCMSPCSKEFKPGVYTYMAYGDDIEAIRIKVELKPGEERSLMASPRAKAVGGLGRATVAVGLTALLTGGTIWGTGALITSSGETDEEIGVLGKQITIGGAIATLGGYAVLSATKGKWE